MALLNSFVPDLRDARVDELEQLTVVWLQAAGQLVKLKQYQCLQEAVDLLCGEGKKRTHATVMAISLIQNSSIQKQINI